MARNARLVEPGTLFHITQRGSNHQEVFLSTSDRAVYLYLAHAHLADCALSLLAYCLMTNHIHWLARPAVFTAATPNTSTLAADSPATSGKAASTPV